MADRCPICGREIPTDSAQNPQRPFCSLRCRQVDLVRWSEGRYAIIEPLAAVFEEEELPPPSEDDS